jgi:hypothetical protein
MFGSHGFLTDCKIIAVYLVDAFRIPIPTMLLITWVYLID